MPGVPSALAEAIKELETMLDEKDAAIMRQEYELAGELRDRVVRLRDHIARLEANRARAQGSEQFYEA